MHRAQLSSVHGCALHPVTPGLHAGEAFCERPIIALLVAVGLADSLAGAVTLFWLAVLQRRAFAMQFGPLGWYEWAFDQPSFNWTW